MPDIERLGAGDYDELIDFLNAAFGYAREDGFERLLPVMWRMTDERMGKHFAVREGGGIRAALGVYPLSVSIAGEKLLFATCGNVGTQKEYRGRGFMSALMQEAMRELDRLGADAARLGGQRQRYGRYGFEAAGTVINYTLTRKNIEASGRAPTGISFAPVTQPGDERIEFIKTLQQADAFHVERGDRRDFLDVMRAWKHGAYLAVNAAGEPVGAVCASADGASIAEQYALNPRVKYDMLRAWLMTSANDSIAFSAGIWDREFIRLAGGECERASYSSPTRLKVINWQKLAHALMKLDGLTGGGNERAVIEIQGYGALCFSGEGCARTQSKADITLDSLAATRLIFGPDRPEDVCDIPARVSAYMRARFPLPMYWNGQDRV